MLKKRIYTALCLAAILFLVLWSQSDWLFGLFLLVFFGAASWENARLFESDRPFLAAIVSGIVFVVAALCLTERIYVWFSLAAVVIWILFLVPSLFRKLPDRGSAGMRIYQWLYWFSILCSFLSVLVLYKRSAFFLLSILVIVWLADIGAYFAGRAFGKHKLAPAISPGKTWEGVMGGIVAVILVATAVVWFSPSQENVASAMFEKYGWAGMLCSLIVLVAMSIVGDLLESKLKRRRGFKDSSNLLPGHGGVLDRIDSLIPVLPDGKQACRRIAPAM